MEDISFGVLLAEVQGLLDTYLPIMSVRVFVWALKATYRKIRLFKHPIIVLFQSVSQVAG